MGYLLNAIGVILIIIWAIRFVSYIAARIILALQIYYIFAIQLRILKGQTFSDIGTIN